MNALPRALAARQQALAKALRDVVPPAYDFDVEREAQAAAPGRPGTLNNYRRQAEGFYVFTPLKNGVVCGPSSFVAPTDPTLSDAGWEATVRSYRACGRDVDLLSEDLATGFFECQSIKPD